MTRVRRSLRLCGLLAVLGALTVGAPTAVHATPVLAPQPAGIVPNPFVSGHAQAYPWGMATLSDGSIAVGDYWNLRVQHYSASGTLLDANFINNAGFGNNTFHQAPYGLGVDPVNGDIYMADTDRYLVHRYSYDPGTGRATLVTSWGAQGAGLNKYLYPSRVAVDSAQHVYVVDTWANNIEVTDNTGTGLDEFGSFGTALGEFKAPHGVAVWYGAPGVADDKLFVVDPNNKRIEVFGDNGDSDDLLNNVEFTFGCPKATTQPLGCAHVFVGDLRGIAIDQSGFVYVVDGAGSKVHKFSTDGTAGGTAFVKSFGKKPVDPYNAGHGEFTDGGREVTVDQNHNVWVGNIWDYRVQVFNSDGAFQFQRPDPTVYPPAGGLNGPRGVAVDPNTGNLFVTDTYNQRVSKFDNGGAPLQQWGYRGRANYGFNYPRMIATDPRNGDVVLVDTDNHNVKKYDANGTWLWTAGPIVGGPVSGKFRNPHGVDVGPDGMIYVADSRSSRAVVLNPNGTASGAFGVNGTANGQFKFPRGIALDTNGTVTQSDDTLWVVDSVRDVVQHFTTSGTYLSQFGSKGTGTNQFGGPFDIEADGTYLYIADANQHVIKVWNDPGPGSTPATFNSQFGGRGTVQGKMIQPQGLDLYAAGGFEYLYVSEQGTDRIQRWQLYSTT
jgi:DNA-binding beta-propeller fold protein YncE